MSEVVVLVGAAGGIGAATALTLAREGWSLLLADRQYDVAAEIAEKLRADGADAEAAQLDVTDERQVISVMDRAVAKWGKLDAVVNCAATLISKPIVETSLEDWIHVMAANSTGTFLTSKHAVRAFLSQGSGGAIVNLGSISGTVALPRQAAYCASKGAVLQLSRQIAVDYADKGIRCNVVSPGSVATEQLVGYLAAQPDPAHAKEQLIAAHPLQRLADPDEIATVIEFLLSSKASFITGADIPVDGGYTAT